MTMVGRGNEEAVKPGHDDGGEGERGSNPRAAGSVFAAPGLLRFARNDVSGWMRWSTPRLRSPR